MMDRRASIIIAAFNEQTVIARTLTALEDAMDDDNVTVYVICNGCTDRTAEISRSFPRVHVVEIEVASKTSALRMADQLAGTGPRIYLDADVVLSSRAANDVIDALLSGAIAGRPPRRFDSRRASWLVRRWYAVRERLPSIAHALWGAGCYALSTAGRARFDVFPEIVSDDLFIDSLFLQEEIEIVNTDPVVITTPRRFSDLVRILRRGYRTQTEVVDDADRFSPGQRNQLRDIRTLLRKEPQRILDVGIYIMVVFYARGRARMGSKVAWERDNSSRELG